MAKPANVGGTVGCFTGYTVSEFFCDELMVVKLRGDATHIVHPAKDGVRPAL